MRGFGRMVPPKNNKATPWKGYDRRFEDNGFSEEQPNDPKLYDRSYKINPTDDQRLKRRPKVEPTPDEFMFRKSRRIPRGA